MNNAKDKYGTILPELGNLLNEVRNEDKEYEMRFDIEYVIDPDYLFAANRKLVEFGLAADSVIVEGPRVTAQLVAVGAEGLESIIKFDGWLTLTKALDHASLQRIELIEEEEKKPLRFRINKLLKRNKPALSTSEIEDEVRAVYMSYGIAI